ncbi:MAG: molybdopterin-dependent oxidoreductase [Burkholderiales bacterium]
MTAPQETKSTCPYCGVGCGVIIESQGAQITGVRGDPDHPANFGRLCSKGSTLALTATAPITLHSRLLQPLRRIKHGAPAYAVSWEDALHEATERFGSIIEQHGPDAVGFYLSGQLLTEDYYVFNKLGKGLIGTNNVDTNSRLCMSSAAAGYKATLGADSPPCNYDDLALAHTLFISGSNTAWAHPILMRRIEDARRANPQQRLIVVDPRKTETADMAELHLQILPGSDIALYHGMLHLMLWEGWIDAAYIAAHTQGFDALKARVREYTPAHTARLTGLKEADIVQAATWFAGLDAGTVNRKPTLSLYCQGLNQSSSGTAKNAALINLHLACRQIGVPGAGPFSLTGQPNAMGGREVGGMANLLSAHRDLANPTHRAEVAQLWGVPEVPAKPGKTAVEMFEAAAEGEIKALWIACTNPAQSLPDQTLVRKALQRCEFVVLQEAFTTATSPYAHLQLPATSWGEKQGTVTNSERRISRVRPAVTPPGETRGDWQIARDFAQQLQARLKPGTPPLFNYPSAESVWNEHRETTRGRDLDITGLSYAMLETQGPQQWPLPEGQAQGKARLYEHGVFPTANGKAQFFDAPFTPLAEPRDARFPFSLITGRLRDQWHGGSRTGTVGRLFGHVPEPVVELHPQDLQRLRLNEGDLVHLTSRRSSIILPVQESTQVATTQAFVAMHWGEEFLSGKNGHQDAATGINALTTRAYCPSSKQPELKHSAIKVLKAELPWRLTAMAWFSDDALPVVRRQLQGLLARFDYAVLVPFGHQRNGLLLRAAAAEVPTTDWVLELETLFGLGQQEPQVLRYEDKKRGQRRALRLVTAGGERRLDAFLLAGDASAQSWMRSMLQTEQATPSQAHRLLAASAKPPADAAPASPQVCNCFNINADQISSTLQRCTGSADERLAQLQGELKCGTQCGSCLPSLRERVRQSLTAA